MAKKTANSRAALVIATAIAAMALPMAGHAQVLRADVSGGTVSGAEENGVSVFKGIPFAAPPVGNLRWRAPAPVKPWKGLRTATAYAPSCIQDASFAEKIMHEQVRTSEDCLYLNVWTPARKAGERLPVMVWIYGGGFALGQTSTKRYDGTNLARRGVVLVSVAYRVGPLGFLVDPELSGEQGGHSGNYGLMDQIAGLKWVRDNIARFGGDPNNVTIFGESAGGISVSMLTASPLAKGLFHKAISESGGNFGPPREKEAENWINMRSLPMAEAHGKAYLNKLGAHDIKAARAMDAEAVTMPGRQMGEFWPNFDGYVLTGDQHRLYSAGQFNDTPILIGTNSDEGSIFQPPVVTPGDFESYVNTSFPSIADRLLAIMPHATNAEARQAKADIMEATVFAWPTWTWARLQSKKGKGAVYMYYFDHKTPLSPAGANHADEIRFVFGNHFGPYANPDASEQTITDQFMGYWTNFARTGDPNGPGLPKWSRFTPDDQQVMGLGDEVGPVPVPDLTRLELWDGYYALRRARIDSMK
jgi:para-nitrobenzyl esterase